MDTRYGQQLRDAVSDANITPFIGVYDVFSSSIAAQHYNGLFLSGFSFAASHYGLPDIGFITWSDLVAFTQRVRTVLPHHHLLVDIDDGHGDAETACHVVSLLEAIGASGVVIEDQKRPRQCGHFPGKQLLPTEEFIEKLTRVLHTRKTLFVVARTDATDSEDRVNRARAYAAAGADAVLIEAVQDLSLFEQLRSQIDRPLMVNQIAGGNSPSWTLTQLAQSGVSLVNYSTPCLFSAQVAMEETMVKLKGQDGLLPALGAGRTGIKDCTSVLYDNLYRRDDHPFQEPMRESRAQARMQEAPTR